tara:strand:- start:66754 stop:67002 length:249 start_codon:yes stop_codon:yes gene_type:complete
MDFRRLTREFMLGESKKPSLDSYIQSIGEVLQSIVPRSRRDERRIEVATANLTEVRRQTRRLRERVTLLEEQVQILEESKKE